MGNSCFLFHDWQKWSEPYKHTMDFVAEDGKKLSEEQKYSITEDRQRRTCNRCGQVQERTI